MKLKLKVNINCPSCAVNIDKRLNKLDTVKSTTSAPLKLVKCEFNEKKVSKEDIINVVKKLNYDPKEI